MATRPIDNYWVILTGAQVPLLFTPTTDIMYHPEINSRADLQAVNTTLIPLGTVYLFNSGTGKDRIFIAAELQSGPADVNDTSEVEPNSYDAVTNDRHWQVTGGLLL